MRRHRNRGHFDPFRSTHLRGVGVCAIAALLVYAAGCGTTRSTDTSRTATEQLLISDSIDRTVQQINLRALAGQSVYLDETYLTGIVDRAYLSSTLRQHMLASGCILASSRDKAEYIVEARAGAVGTNHHELLFGIPAVNLPSVVGLTIGVPTSIPEVPIVKRTDRRGVTKLAVYAYHRESGAPIWQSGIAVDRSTAKDTWVLGAGPFQRGTIHQGYEFAGSKIPIPLGDKSSKPGEGPVAIQDEHTFLQSPSSPILLPPIRQAEAPASAEDGDEETTTK